MATDDRIKVLDAMRSGEWLRTQWIARVAFEAPPPADHREPTMRALRVLRRLREDGAVVSRAAAERRAGELVGVPARWLLPRTEWRLA